MKNIGDLIQKQFERIDKVIQDNPERAKEITKDCSPYVKEQVEKIISRKKIPVANHLSDMEYDLLMRVYADHNSSMGLEKRKNYNLGNIVKVERNLEKLCLNVYYDNGDWWHYKIDGTWY